MCYALYHNFKKNKNYYDDGILLVSLQQAELLNNKNSSQKGAARSSLKRHIFVKFNEILRKQSISKDIVLSTQGAGMAKNPIIADNMVNGQII